MISYKPFYETLRKKGMTQYRLIHQQSFSSNTLHRIKHGMSMSMKTLNELCFVLNCKVTDVMTYVKD